MKLTIRPVSPDLWPVLEDLFGKNVNVGRCWCMYWRIGSAYRQRLHEENRAAFREIVERGPPPGLLAFDSGLAVGWCQLTPRDAVPWLDRTWRLRRVDDLPVWSLSCFYVRKGYRRQGIATALIQAALRAAKHGGAPALEAYPFDAGISPSATSTGYVSTFLRPVLRPSPAAPHRGRSCAMIWSASGRRGRCWGVVVRPGSSPSHICTCPSTQSHSPIPCRG